MKYLILFLVGPLAIASCLNQTKDHTDTLKSSYQKLVAKAAKMQITEPGDVYNVLDDSLYDPAMPDASQFFDTLQQFYLADSVAFANTGSSNRPIAQSGMHASSANMQSDQPKNSDTDPSGALAFNLNQLHHALSNADDSISNTSCRQIQCKLWAKISLSEQRLYLYADGILLDTMLVSTGIRKHETPLMERRPSGPMFVKYTSKKFPGGNYMGMGNMPYAIFIRGGYAIHGTTTGNIAKLGHAASHGCIRLHPEKAMVFFEMVKQAGLENTWISIQP